MNVLPESIRRAYAENEELKLGGYFRYISEDMQAQLKDILVDFSKWEDGVPFAVSCFGEILSWTTDGFVMLYNLPMNKVSVLLEGFEFFAMYIADRGVQNDYLMLDLYLAACEKYGTPTETECFTFEPIPAMGGTATLNSIAKGNTLAYISVIIQLLNSKCE